MIEPDDKDWTWVIAQRCPECGFDGSAVSHTEVAGRIRADADEWPRRLGAVDATVRPRPAVWSALEYGCHVRDVHRIFNERVGLMLSEDEPRFPNWDQDATAIDDDYASQDPTVVASELVDAARAVADTYDARSVRRVVAARVAQQRQRVHRRVDRGLSLARHRPPRARCRPWLTTHRWQARSRT